MILNREKSRYIAVSTLLREITSIYEGDFAI